MKKDQLVCKICVGALIQNQLGEVLLVKKGYGIFKDMWTFPEGYAEENELPEQALIRELKEELGAEIKIDHLLAIRFRKTVEENTVYFIFRATVLNLDKLKVDGHELVGLEFMREENALINEQVYSLVKFILSKKSSGKVGEFGASDFLPTEIPATSEDYVLYLYKNAKS